MAEGGRAAAFASRSKWAGRIPILRRRREVSFHAIRGHAGDRLGERRVLSLADSLPAYLA